jgi:hypothetical protein
LSDYQKDPRVDDYIATLPTWQQHIAQNVRNLVHSADPDVIETIKFINRPYFVLEGNICALLGAKDHLNVFIYDPIVPDPGGIINQGQNNKAARAIQIYENDVIDEKAFVNLISAVIKNNRAGGWHKLQAKK